MKALKHGFETIAEIHDLAQMVGYQRCLTDLNSLLNEEIKSRYTIGISELKECIRATTKELVALAKSEKDIKSILDNLTKSIPL